MGHGTLEGRAGLKVVRGPPPTGQERAVVVAVVVAAVAAVAAAVVAVVARLDLPWRRPSCRPWEPSSSSSPLLFRLQLTSFC